MSEQFMKSTTLNALLDSIRHWEENLEHLKNKEYSQIDDGRKACSLCSLFWTNECFECPVFERTEVKRCEETPYWDVHYILEKSSIEDWEDGVDADESIVEQIKECMEKEIDFLRSLLRSLLPDEVK